MPSVSGADVTREIRQRWGEVVVIAMSVQADAARAESGRSAGADAFVSTSERPEDPVDLILETVRRP